MTDLTRRSALFGLGTLFVAAPAIVRASSIMPVKAMSVGIVYGKSPVAELLDQVRWLEAYNKEFIAIFKRSALLTSDFSLDTAIP